jgi:DNA polymerase-3 subunit delta'
MTADATGVAAAGPWGLTGQAREVEALARSVAERRHAHAYLFAGPAQSGKGTLARRLAQALNCESPATVAGVYSPCGVCRACRHIEEGKHPDVEVVSPGGLCAESDHDHRKDNSRDIKICQVRALGARLSLSPFEGRYRVVIVDPADAMNVYAADAFLKTLEEPPDSVVIILLSAKEEVLLETVRSRLRRVELRQVTVEELEQVLVARGAAPEEAAAVARLSRGCAGWALNAVADRTMLEARAKLLDEIVALAGGGRYERFGFAADLAGRWTRDRAGVTAVLETWTGWWRDVLVAAAGSERSILNVDRMEQIRNLAAGVRVGDTAAFVQALRDVRGQLEENANARLALEVLMLRIPEPRGSGAATRV